MLCRKCGGKLKVTNTYSGNMAKSAIAACKTCGTKHTLLTLNIAADSKGAFSLLRKVDTEMQKTGDIKEALKDIL